MQLGLRAALATGALMALLLALPASAQQSDTTLLVAARALSFLQHAPQGDVVVGIVYQPRDAQSAQEAQQLSDAMENGFRAGTLLLRPQLVDLDKLTANGIGLYFLTAGLGRQAEALAALSRSHQIPCITTDIAQVRDGNCAMGVRALPRVEILVNRAAATATGMAFSEAFRVMITEM